MRGTPTEQDCIVEVAEDDLSDIEFFMLEMGERRRNIIRGFEDILDGYMLLHYKGIYFAFIRSGIGAMRTHLEETERKLLFGDCFSLDYKPKTDSAQESYQGS